MVTFNHIHLLVADTGKRDVIAKSMKLVAGRTGQEYNKRKNRKEVCWEFRGPPYLIIAEMNHFCYLSFMTRIARAVAPWIPYHATQRENRRQQTFLKDDTMHREIVAHWCGHDSVEIWAYCLVPDHIHLIAVPETAETEIGLSRKQGRTGRSLGKDTFIEKMEHH